MRRPVTTKACVLLLLARDEVSWGRKMERDLTALGVTAPTRAAFIQTLGRLERQGLIQRAEPPKLRSGGAPSAYRLTPRGHERVAEFRGQLQRLAVAPARSAGSVGSIGGYAASPPCVPSSG